MILLLISALIEPFAKRINIPFSIVLVLVGFIGSEIVVNLFDIDTGIRWHNFHDIIFYVLLPILIFNAAIEIELKSLKENILPIFILAIPLMVISAGVTALFVYRGIDHPTGFPWIAALLTGALLSATDPAAVLAVLKNSNTPERLSMLLEGESLFNDATAIVLFSILIAIAVTDTQSTTWDTAFVHFLKVFFGGLVIGSFIGIAGHIFNKILNQPYTYVLVTLVCAYGAFIVAEKIFHCSGVMAVLAAGLIIGQLNKDIKQSDISHLIDTFWGFLAYVAEALIFLLAGVSIIVSMFADRWLAIMIGIAAVIIARAVIIFGLFPLINIIPSIEPVPFRHQFILTWGGVRGTVTLALALSLPLELDYWYTIQSIAYGVVLFTLFFQATSIRFLVNRLN